MERIGDRLDDLVRAAVDGYAPARRTAGGEEAQLGERELPLVEDLDHRPADDAGCADDRDGEGLACHVGHGSAVSVTSGTGRVYQRVSAVPRAGSGPDPARFSPYEGHARCESSPVAFPPGPPVPALTESSRSDRGSGASSCQTMPC